MGPNSPRLDSACEDEPADVAKSVDTPARMSGALRVLLIAHDSTDARRIQRMVFELQEGGIGSIEMDWVRDLAEGLGRVERAQAVLLDLSMPDSGGLGSLEELCRRADIPVVVILGHGYDRWAIESLSSGGQGAIAGAHDYLVKGDFDGETLLRSVRYAVERHGLIRQLRQAQKMEIVGRLASGIAHDFSNIVTAISLHAEHLRRNIPPTDPLLERAQDIQQAARRGSRLTNQLLAFSSRQEWNPEVVDLNVMVRDVGIFYQRVLGEDITVSESLADGLGRVRADPNQLEQVILNLVANARDAMPNGGRLSLSTGNLDTAGGEMAIGGVPIEPGRYVRLTIEDTGCGIDPTILDQIIDPSFTTERRGRGFGLSTVYGIVQQSGGHIKVESQRRRGTKLSVLLPRVEAPVPLAAEASGTVTLGGYETILLVEDDVDLLPLIGEALRQQGYEVLEADSARRALAAAQAHSGALDLVIADLVMPDSRAPELVERLREHRPGLKVLFMSGYVDEGTFSRAANLDRIPFIEKPFRTSDLCFRVRQVLDDEAWLDAPSM